MKKIMLKTCLKNEKSQDIFYSTSFSDNISCYSFQREYIVKYFEYIVRCSSSLYCCRGNKVYTKCWAVQNILIYCL